MIVSCTCTAFEPTGNTDIRPESAHLSLESAVRYLASFDRSFEEPDGWPDQMQLLPEEERITDEDGMIRWYGYECIIYEDGVLLCDPLDGVMVWSVRRLEVMP